MGKKSKWFEAGWLAVFFSVPVLVVLYGAWSSTCLGDSGTEYLRT